MNHRCMARNKDDSARCERRATKMLATEGRKEFDFMTGLVSTNEPSVPTLRICGICTRRLHAGSQSLYLELDDGSRHAAWVSDQDRIRTQEIGVSS